MPKKKTLNSFISEAKQVHGDKYDYSKVEYIDSHTKVCIICPEHGEFWQNAYSYLQGRGCPKCNESKLEREIRVMLSEKKLNLNNIVKTIHYHILKN